MPRFEPFRALRYAPGADLAKVTAPPYDVLSDADVTGLAARDPHNIVHVDVPRGGADRYDVAARLFRAWLAQGVLVGDSEPSFTIYRRRFIDQSAVPRDVVGVLGALEVVDQGAGGVLPHERTTPKASTDRLDLTRTTEANLSPVWCLSRSAGLSEVLAAPGERTGSATVDGVEHVVERVTDPGRVAAIGDVAGRTAVLIADGHHRYAVARDYRDEVRAATGRTDTPAELTLAFVGELVADQLSIEAIHRVYRGVGHDALLRALSRFFHAEPGSGGRPGPPILAQMQAQGRLGLVGPAGWHWLVPRSGAFDGIRALDGAWLEHALRDTAVSVTYQHGVDETVGLVQGGSATAAVLIRPVPIQEIERTATEGLLMPPKSTYFAPKLRTGLVMRELA
ncbi:MAG TPA: DUF1015 domain-containing protein [Dermatophilaceae bacterium]|nr:DUF1015 domain-containing protein [Dermatophilaceae bacterium]